MSEIKIAGTPLDNALEAINILREVLYTPNARSVHFELDVSVNDIPVVQYEVERIVLKEGKK